MLRRKSMISITVSVLLGIIVAVVFSLICNGIAATLILNERINEKILKVLPVTILFVATLLGSMIAGKMANRKYGISSSAVIISILLLQIGVNIIFFDGTFRGFVKNLISEMVGGGLSCFILMKGTRKKRIRR